MSSTSIVYDKKRSNQESAARSMFCKRTFGSLLTYVLLRCSTLVSLLSSALTQDEDAELVDDDLFLLSDDFAQSLRLFDALPIAALGRKLMQYQLRGKRRCYPATSSCPACLPACMSLCPVRLSVSLSVCLSVCLLVCVCLSVCLYIFLTLSVCLLVSLFCLCVLISR